VAEAEYTTTARLPLQTIWDFVCEMDQWAPMLTGYQSHQKEGSDDSVWVLKGDLGVLSRTLKLRVHVTEWAGPYRVSFALEGLNEPLRGRGEFLLESHEEAGAAAAPVRRGLFARLADALARFFFGLVHGRPQRAASAGAGPGAGMAKLTFRLRLDPGGPMAPMLDAMLAPALRPAAEDLANKIMAHLEAQRGLR
jgi:carbon monoxide dehydrogenase subunit G